MSMLLAAIATAALCASAGGGYLLASIRKPKPPRDGAGDEKKKEGQERQKGKGAPSPEKRPRAGDIDRRLHRARLIPGTRRQATFTAAAGDLPDGAFVRYEDAAHLVFRGALHPYRHDRYGPATSLPADQVDVLTPAPVAAVLRAGYRPELHPSASGVRPTSRPS